MKNPFDLIKDRLNHEIFEKNYSFQFFNKIEEKITDNILKKINDRLTEKTPELLMSFVDTYKELTLIIKENEKIVKFIEKKSKKLFESSSLTEDVYKIRDEIKDLKNKIDKLNSGLRNFAKLSELISSEK